MKLLFVDDDRQILRGLSRMVECWEHDWDVRAAESGAEALRILEDERFDAVVTDMRMPGMDGADLLNQIAQRRPHMVRIVLSGQSDRRSVHNSLRSTHLFLAKPCESQTLEATLTRVCLLPQRLRRPQLRAFLTGLSTLPSAMSHYDELLDAIDSGRRESPQVAEVVARDPAMAAKVLQLANSAVFGRSSHVCSPADAVRLLGLETIKQLVYFGQIFRPCQASDECIDAVIRHSWQVARRARAIAMHESADQQLWNAAFTGGLLHDIGKIVLCEADREAYAEAERLAADCDIPQWQAENELIGAAHDVLGAQLLTLWGLPQPVVEAVARHHEPADTEEFTPAAAVAAANFASHADSPSAPDAALHRALERQGLTARYEQWRRSGLFDLQGMDR